MKLQTRNNRRRFVDNSQAVSVACCSYGGRYTEVRRAEGRCAEVRCAEVRYTEVRYAEGRYDLETVAVTPCRTG